MRDEGDVLGRVMRVRRGRGGRRNKERKVIKSWGVRWRRRGSKMENAVQLEVRKREGENSLTEKGTRGTVAYWKSHNES